jgi:hypothetical protein
MEVRDAVKGFNYYRERVRKETRKLLRDSGFNAKTARHIAMGAVRAEIRSMAQDPIDYTPDMALEIAGTLNQENDRLIASIWFRLAQVGAHEKNAFRREWRSWIHKEHEQLRMEELSQNS